MNRLTCMTYSLPRFATIHDIIFVAQSRRGFRSGDVWDFGYGLAFTLEVCDTGMIRFHNRHHTCHHGHHACMDILSPRDKLTHLPKRTFDSDAHLLDILERHAYVLHAGDLFFEPPLLAYVVEMDPVRHWCWFTTKNKNEKHLRQGVMPYGVLLHPHQEEHEQIYRFTPIQVRSSSFI